MKLPKISIITDRTFIYCVRLDFEDYNPKVLVLSAGILIILFSCLHGRYRLHYQM